MVASDENEGDSFLLVDNFPLKGAHLPLSWPRRGIRARRRGRWRRARWRCYVASDTGPETTRPLGSTLAWSASTATHMRIISKRHRNAQANSFSHAACICAHRGWNPPPSLPIPVADRKGDECLRIRRRVDTTEAPCCEFRTLHGSSLVCTQ